MSYNISKWKTKKLEGLTIPVAAFQLSPRMDWHPEIVYSAGRDVVLRCGCEQEIKATLRGKKLIITEFKMSGEGSGTFYNEVLEAALKESKGFLEAVLIWERGDFITRLTVKDGVVTSEDVEL